jgi:hypothetical protein
MPKATMIAFPLLLVPHFLCEMIWSMDFGGSKFCFLPARAGNARAGLHSALLLLLLFSAAEKYSPLQRNN